MRTWLVTGGAGFIGSNFVRRMLSRHADLRIANLDKLTYAGNPANLEGLDPERHRLVQGDIADPEVVTRCMQGVEVVVNFAAESHVDRSLMEAASFVRTNVEGVYVLAEAARKAGVRSFVQVSTDEVYGSRLMGSFKEADMPSPRNPYSAAKLGGERLAWSYHASFGLPVIITRGSNTFGPYQYPEKVIPLFVTNALLDRELPLYGDGMNVRDWLHVDDHCAAIELLIERGQAGETYNISAGNERPNREVTELLLDTLGKPRSLIKLVRDREGHDRRYSIDSSRLRQLGWAPAVELETGLRQTVDWYQSHGSWWQQVRGEAFEEYYRRQYGDR